MKRGRKQSNPKRPGRTAPGPLTPQGGNGREAKATLTAAVRRKRAVDLYVMGRLPMHRIAEQLTAEGLPCTTKTICLDLHAAFDEVNAQRVATVVQGQAQEGMRLDHLDRQLLPLAVGEFPGDVTHVGTGKQRRAITKPLRAVDQVRLQLDALSALRRNSESRRRLYGWDAAPDEGLIRVDQVAAMMRGMVADVLALTADNMQLRRALAGVMRKRLGMMAIEAKAVAEGA